MDSGHTSSYKYRFSVISFFLREHFSQISEKSNLRFQKYYNKLLDRIHSYHEIILDEKGTILTWNKNFEMLEGYREEEIIGQSFNLFYLPGDRQHKLPDKLLETAGLDGKSRHFGQFVKKGGSTFWGNIILTAVKKNDKELLGYVVLCRQAMKR